MYSYISCSCVCIFPDPGKYCTIVRTVWILSCCSLLENHSRTLIATVFATHAFVVCLQQTSERVHYSWGFPNHAVYPNLCDFCQINSLETHSRSGLLLARLWLLLVHFWPCPSLPTNTLCGPSIDWCLRWLPALLHLAHWSAINWRLPLVCIESTPELLALAEWPQQKGSKLHDYAVEGVRPGVRYLSAAAGQWAFALLWHLTGGIKASTTKNQVPTSGWVSTRA